MARSGISGPSPRVETRRARVLQQALDKRGWSRAAAARTIGISESTLCRNLRSPAPTTRSLRRLQGLLQQLGETVNLEDLR